MSLYELRQYKIKHGRTSQWVELMDSTIIPYVVSKGMVVAASFQHETDETIYIWIRRFKDETHRDLLYKAVYDDEHWKKKISPKIGELIDRDSSVINRLLPTRSSVLQ